MKERTNRDKWQWFIEVIGLLTCFLISINIIIGWIY